MTLQPSSGIADVLSLYGFGVAFVAAFLYYAVLINIALCIFNMIPLGPLDGMWILGTFLPPEARAKWTIFILKMIY